MDKNQQKSITKIIDIWKVETAINIQLHLKSANYFNRLLKIITIPNIIILAITGTTLLSTISTDEQVNKILTIIAGILITISTFIQTLQQFLKWEDKETIHNNVAKLYQIIQQELDKYPIYLASNNDDLMKEFINHIDSINKIITQIKYEPPQHIYLEYGEEVLQTQNINPYSEIKKISLEIMHNDSTSNQSDSSQNSGQLNHNIKSIPKYSSCEDISSIESNFSNHKKLSLNQPQKSFNITTQSKYQISNQNLQKFQNLVIQANQTYQKNNKNITQNQSIPIPNIKLQETAIQIENNLKKLQEYAKQRNSIKKNKNYPTIPVNFNHQHTIPQLINIENITPSNNSINQSKNFYHINNIEV